MFSRRVFYFVFLVLTSNYATAMSLDPDMRSNITEATIQSIISQEFSENVTQVSSTKDDISSVTNADDNKKPENATKLFRDDFYSRSNVKFPTEDHQSLSTWLKTKQLIFLLGGIGTCVVLLIGIAITKMLLGHDNDPEVRDNTYHSQRQLLIESIDQAEALLEDSAEVYISSDEEDIAATSEKINQRRKYQRVN